jgi:hypothetical protein
LGGSVLREGDPAFAFDDFNPFCSVEAAPAQHDAGGQTIAVAGERLEELIDGQMEAVDLHAGYDPKGTVLDE